jgi:hypothetical protein
MLFDRVHVHLVLVLDGDQVVSSIDSFDAGVNFNLSEFECLANDFAVEVEQMYHGPRLTR